MKEGEKERGHVVGKSRDSAMVIDDDLFWLEGIREGVKRVEGVNEVGVRCEYEGLGWR